MAAEKTFQTIRTLGKAKGFPIILQAELLDGKVNCYCVQYAGNGHYFDTKEEAEDYAFDRWGC